MRIMSKLKVQALSVLLGSIVTLPLACGGDDDGATEADRIGVAAECDESADCREGQDCLTQFRGGYCGLADCASDEDCPQGSACVAHDDGQNYCFRICLDKADCNRNRSLDNAANCSANITFVDGQTDIKACVPPSS